MKTPYMLIAWIESNEPGVTEVRYTQLLFLFYLLQHNLAFVVHLHRLLGDAGILTFTHSSAL